MADSYRVEVTGLRELRRALREVDRALPGQLAAVNHAAAEVVAVEARRRAPRGPHEGGPKDQPFTPITESIRALNQQTKGVIAAGGVRTPHAAVLEFGGTIPRHHSRTRTTVRAQPSVYPALRAKRDEVVDVYSRALEALMTRAFPN
jgi:hypothetical protein